MSYFDPLYPAYQATRYEIQKTIYGLEGKLRRRKQLDLLIEQQLIQKQAIHRQRQLLSVDYTINQISAQNQLRQSLRRLRMYDVIPRRQYNIYPELSRQRQFIQLDYLDRLNQFRRQKQLLYLNSLNNVNLNQINQRKQYDGYSTQAKRGYQNYHSNINSNDDQLLVKKYQDGSKINQYNQQLNQSNNKSHTDRYVSSNNKYSSNAKYPQYNQQLNGSKNKSQTDRFGSSNNKRPQFEYESIKNNEKSTNNQNNQNRTPFDKLKATQPDKQVLFNNLKLKAQVEKNKKKLYNQDEPTQQQTKSRIEQQKQQLRKQHQRQNPNRKSLSPSKRSRSKSRYQSKSPYKNKNLSKFNKNLRQSRQQQFPRNALKKIQNRLAVSSQIYVDSKYRNIKHQVTHLYSTYENQLKIRKDIKNKINNHPLILRKHAKVVQ